MLSIARALALDPVLLLLDEPFEGLSPAIIPAIGDAIAAIARSGPRRADRRVEHPPRAPPGRSRLYVVERGEIIFAGPLDQAQRDATVLRIIGGKPS